MTRKTYYCGWLGPALRYGWNLGGSYPIKGSGLFTIFFTIFSSIMTDLISLSLYAQVGNRESDSKILKVLWVLIGNFQNFLWCLKNYWFTYWFSFKTFVTIFYWLNLSLRLKITKVRCRLSFLKLEKKSRKWVRLNLAE